MFNYVCQMESGFERVAEAVERVRWFLFSYGDLHITSRLVALADDLRARDRNAVVSAISETTGGMGSLRDRYICPENGDKLASEEVEAVNEKLNQLITTVEREARAAAAEYGITLMR